MERWIKFRYALTKKGERKIRFYKLNLFDVENGHTEKVQTLIVWEGWHIIARDEFIDDQDEDDEDIYEGDIVRYQGKVSEVAWSHDDCQFKLKGITDLSVKGKPKYQKIFGYLCKVIGNRWQNPELLKEKYANTEK